jgi:drug/metabolite transporter (DMT)-like permease
MSESGLHQSSKSSRLLGPALATGAAISFALSVPLGKWLLGEVGSFSLAGILYLGAGIALTLYRLLSRRRGAEPEPPESPDLPASLRRSRLALAGAIVSGGIIAPALLLYGLVSLPAPSVSLFLSLEVVFTALLAGLLFREQVAKRVWLAVIIMAAASVLLAWTGGRIWWSFSILAIVLATLFWGLDNNLTREIQAYSATAIAQLKGLVAGSVNLLIGIFALGQLPNLTVVLAGAALGAVSYGLSLVLFVKALRVLGSARTGAYFSSAPLLAALLSLAIFVQKPGLRLVGAFALMVLATILMMTERHVHEHAHGDIVHTHSHWPDQEHRHPHRSTPPSDGAV